LSAKVKVEVKASSMTFINGFFSKKPLILVTNPKIDPREMEKARKSEMIVCDTSTCENGLLEALHQL
jgi:hypothetical protein